jgi:2-(1,2-epoxy-1,2-dihydrophenyl)acetyl-CoA isomerase
LSDNPYYSNPENDVLSALDGGILTITINRPGRMNAVTTRVGNQLSRIVQIAAIDPDVRVVVVTGAGRGFCAGGDFKDIGAADQDDPLAAKWGDTPLWNGTEMRTQRVRASADAYYLLHSMLKPTIAMIRGPAIGAGMALALAPDMRIASETAIFVTGYANMALSGDIGTSFYLTHTVGPAKARELMFTGERLDAKAALAIGLVNRVVPDDLLEEETMALASQLARGPTLAYGYMKQNLNAAVEADACIAFDVEARNFIRCFETEDQKEATLAFREKRAPAFKGR